MSIEIKIPKLGESIEGGNVTSVLVKAGDTVKTDQALLEMETGKATMEIPSPQDGVVVAITVKPGDYCKVGQVIGTLSPAHAPAAAPQAAASPAPAAPPPGPAPEPRVVAPAPAPDTEGRTAPFVAPIERPRHAPVPAAPSVRKFARELGLEIREVPGTGAGGRLSIADVKAHQKRLNTGAASRAASPGTAPAALPDFSRFGETEREPMNIIRKVTVRHLSSCWATIPHVTQFDQADTTQLDLVRKAYAQKAGEGGVKVTLTALLVKLLARALHAHPKFNASVDLLREEIVYKHYIHVGIAVDTPKGLLVPVIQNAATKGVLAIARDLNTVAEKARKGRISPDDLAGGCMSITNLGGLGGKHFTPIINAPEVAILGVGRASLQPVWVDGAFVARPLLPLSLSYDHRLIDGADGTRFLRWLVEAIEQPIAHLLEDPS